MVGSAGRRRRSGGALTESSPPAGPPHARPAVATAHVRVEVQEDNNMRYAVAWLLGVPGIVILLWMLVSAQ